MPGLGAYEDGSTARGDWFASPVHLPPLPFVVRVDDTTGHHLPLVREVLVPVPAPVRLALPPSPSAQPPAGSLRVEATVVTEAGTPRPAAVKMQLSLSGFVTGGVTDAHGVAVVPFPRAVSATSTGTPTGGAGLGAHRREPATDPRATARHQGLDRATRPRSPRC